MKLYKSILLGMAGILSAGAVSSCSDEKDTLSGADAVYIEITPTDISVAAGDTVYLSAAVTNVSGKTINTPVTWSVDDENIAKLVEVRTGKPVKSKSRAEGDDETGDVDNEEANDSTDLDEPAPAPVDTVWTSRMALIGQQGAQGKTTRVRATLENGQYAVTAVNVVARSINNAISAYTDFKRSYQRSPNDTVWFQVEPYNLVNESEITYELSITKMISPAPDEADNLFHQNHADPKDNIVYDPERHLVGVVYDGPRCAALAQCEMTITNSQGSSSAIVPIYVIPALSPGFEYQGKRPNYGPESPSNIKLKLITETMDINSSFNVGVCIGIDCGSNIEIEHAYNAELAGLMEWTVEGSAVVIEDVFVDFDYESGYVSYLRVRSGSREGFSKIEFHMPEQTLVCNLTVENYNVSHPVDSVTFKKQGEPISEALFKMGSSAELSINVEPDASFQYHRPEVTVADPSILEVQPYVDGEGDTRRFTLKKPGTTMITATALGKSTTIPVTVEDQCLYIQWQDIYSSSIEMMENNSTEISAKIAMAYNSTALHAPTWHVSDPTVLQVTPNASVYGKATITALKEGSCDIYVEYDGVISETLTINVTAAADIYASSYAEDRRAIGDMTEDGAGIYIVFYTPDDDIAIYAEMPSFATLYGTYSASDGLVDFNGTYEDVAYNVTVERDPTDEGYCYITGTFTLSNGIHIIMNHDRFYFE